MRLLKSPAVIAALIVLDLVVLVAAYWITRDRPQQAGADSVASALASPTAAAGEEAVTGPLFLVASEEGALVRVTRGACDDRAPEPAVVWSAQRGADLRRVAVPGLVEALGVARDGDTIRIAGADAECRLAGFTSTDAGATWAQGPVPTSVWRLELDRTATVVVGPSTRKPVQVACVPSSVQSLADGGAVAVCPGSLVRLPSRADDVPQIYATTEAGAGALVEGRMLALGRAADCVTLFSVSLTGRSQAVSCIAEGAAPLGLAAGGGRIFVQAGYDLYVSSDDGASFEPTA